MKLRCLLVVLTACYQVFAQGPSIVWLHEGGGDRNEYVFFQKSVQIDDVLKSAQLHLYADSRYALYVNGKYVNFGPARSYHNQPYYDTYDLSGLLVNGENCLVVKVLSNGLETYQLYDYHGGFAAWGSVETASKTVDLNALQWRCRPSKGYVKNMPRFSFATGALENWDAFKDVGWNNCADTNTVWQKPVLLNVDRWGDFKPRPIPKLGQQEVLARRTNSPLALHHTEALYSLRIPTSDTNGAAYNRSQKAIGYTCIFSEEEKVIPMGLWWGDYFVNGERLKPDPDYPETNYRRQYNVKLKKGWNFFVVKYGIIWGSWEFYMVFPKKVAVTVSPERSKTDKNWFKTFLPVSKEDVDRYSSLDLLKTTHSIENLFSREFAVHPKKETADHPVRDMVWKRPNPEIRVMSLNNGVDGGEYLIPEAGMALRYEMPEIQLGRFFVEGTFPKGTIVDIGFSEEPHPNGGPWLYKRLQVAAGLRFRADGSTKRYESFKPYGAKYLQLHIYGANKKIRIKKVGMVRQVYPFESLGNFQCNDTILNKIYEAGWRTLQLCSEDSYTDTPFRERGLYAGDMLPEVAITMAMNGDMRLARHSLSVFQDMYRDEMHEGKQNRHNDFPLITLLSANYISEYTGDFKIAEEYYDNYASLLRGHLNRKSTLGLVHADRVFIEWTDINKEDAFMTAFQALLVESLKITATWASKLGKTSDADYFEKEAGLLMNAINTHLWDAKKGMYRDGIKKGKEIPRYHLTSSIWPAFFDVANTMQVKAIIENLKRELVSIGNTSRKRKITPYSAFYLFSFLYKHGETALADRFMKEHWAPMALHSDKPTTWENFDILGDQGTSSHAWSGHPTYFLATTVLGVNLGWYQEMDAEEITIAPQSAYLEWAKGTVMHPLGAISVSWRVEKKELHLTYKAPKGIQVRVVPKGRLGMLPLHLTRKEN